MQQLSFARWLIAPLLAGNLLIAGCAFAPGMQFSDTTAATGNTPAQLIEINSDTIDTIRKRDELVPNHEEDLTALLGEPAPYRIGASDILSVIVWDHPELVMPNLTYDIGSTGGAQPQSVGMASQSVPGYAVSTDGYIQFPYVGQFKVAGLTEGQVKARLVRALDPFVKDPQISLRVVGYRSRRVFVSGQVRTPGVKPITDIPMTLANAINEASGVLDSGDASHVQLIRAGRIYGLDLPRMASRGIDVTKIMLTDGDEVKVPLATDFTVTVMGEVLKPGLLRLNSDGRLSLAQALGAAQINQTTSDPSKIYLVRPSSSGGVPEVMHFDGKSPQAIGLAQSVNLHPDDVVFVDAPGVVRWNRVVSQLLGGTSAAYNMQRAASGAW